MARLRTYNTRRKIKALLKVSRKRLRTTLEQTLAAIQSILREDAPDLRTLSSEERFRYLSGDQ